MAHARGRRKLVGGRTGGRTGGRPDEWAAGRVGRAAEPVDRARSHAGFRIGEMPRRRRGRAAPDEDGEAQEVAPDPRRPLPSNDSGGDLRCHCGKGELTVNRRGAAY